MLNGIKQSAQRAAKKSALTALAIIAVLVGFGFFTAAAWTGLALAYDPMMASLIIGAAFIGVAVIFTIFSLTMGHHTVEQSSHHDQMNFTQSASSSENSNLSKLIEAFVFGMNTGMKSDQK
ncbi:hypothetical protein GCM10008927_06060 [Amylibacter ulvae]|uniref:Uncharacterized protein n=1 Tax=Paramylibacter ulvae TaxID=1651968 RepID=A0ABQ3CW53_9RHOB|nr:phage holin family protein [Amylibacter ulvae]GHA44072.1 hypothetical protein GCM10008927_06060 [Amylibacter ulvae]